MTLADTSVWVEYLRRGHRGWAAELDELLERGELLVCGPVVSELLAGVRGDHRGGFAVRLAALPWAELGHDAWMRIGTVSGDLRRRGIVVGLADAAIAVAAAGAGALLWSADADHERLAEVMGELTLRYQPR